MKPKYRVVTELYQDGIELHYPQVKWFCIWINLDIDGSPGIKVYSLEKTHAFEIIRKHIANKIINRTIEYYNE